MDFIKSYSTYNDAILHERTLNRIKYQPMLKLHLGCRLHLSLFCAGLVAVAAYDRPHIIQPGPYCGGISKRCCRGREDGCSTEVLDTLCYCDDFCDRGTRDDCCPDYFEVCRRQTQPPPPAPIIACEDRNKYYQAGVKITRGCNECVCHYDPNSQKTYFKCDTDPCIMSDVVLRGVASDPYSTWLPYNYTQFHGKKLKEGIVYKLGTILSDEVRYSAVPLSTNKKGVVYPRSFDAKENWPEYISPVVDQGWCGSDWAVTVATVASDRFAIQSNGAEKVVLSPQILLSCNKEQEGGCNGGHIDRAWNYANLFGLVDEECLPYKAKVGRCKFAKRDDLVKHGCRPVVAGRTERYRVGPVYRVKNETDIMYEIMNSGPVHAVMKVHQDFFHYHGGIYRRSRYGNNNIADLHSVRITGWGEDRDDKYWIVANSWGCDWGENGYFRIARGENESDIESFVVAALSEVTHAYMKT